MPRFRVTLKRPSIEIVEADNPFMAALAARERYGDGVEISNVTPASGRPARATAEPRSAAKKTAKKRRPLSPETRAKLARNLVKARAARAAKRKATKKQRATKTQRGAKRR